MQKRLERGRRGGVGREGALKEKARLESVGGKERR